MEFLPGVFAPDNLQGEHIWFAFYRGKLLMMQDQQGMTVPRLANFEMLGLDHHESHYMGILAGTHCFAVALKRDDNLPPGFFIHDLRRLAVAVDPNLFMVAGRARQILEWDYNHQYCGRCGSKTEHHNKDRAKLCPRCGHTQYPRISPCVIMLITRGYEVLLARSHNFPDGLFSTLAGFVETGETLEMAVHREIKEEVGVEVCNLKYMGSQPWPFPHSLMVGFHAQYKSGDILLEDDEIAEAGWFLLDQLPNIPPQGSISRNLIDTYIEQMRHE